MLHVVQYSLLALTKNVDHFHVGGFPVQKVPYPIVNIPISQHVGFGAKLNKNLRHLVRLEKVCDSYVGIDLRSLN
jgi:hypothetical protein